MKNRLILLIYYFCTGALCYGQELLTQLDEELDTSLVVLATFKTTRISIGHSVETRKKGTSQFEVMTRYWNTPQTQSNSFVADRMSARFGADYAFTNSFTLGAGISTLDGIADVFGKLRLLQQRSNKGSWLSITAVQAASYRTKNFNNVMLNGSFSDRYNLTTQLLLARKFTRAFSFQIAPTYIHRSSSAVVTDDRNHFALGFGGRYKLGNHVSLVSEYYWLANEIQSIEAYNPFLLGVNWEMGDLILQFKLTNARNFVEDTFITQTPVNFNFRNANLSFGFHVNYIIHW